MTRAIPFLLTGCTTPPVNCAHAPKYRAAAVMTLQALDRICPMDNAGSGYKLR